MGQYYITCNLDRQEHLHPHTLGDGLKLTEFGGSSQSTMAALAALICMRGGAEPFKGPWAANRVVVAGDYADKGSHLPADLSHLNLATVAMGVEAEDGNPGRGPWADARDSACQAIAKLDMPWRLSGSRRSRHAGALSDELAWLASDGTAFLQPEDLVEAFGLAPCEDLVSSIEAICTALRVEGVKSSCAWQTVHSAEMELDATGGHAVGLTAIFGDRGATSAAECDPARTLAFPAKASDVRRWLGITLP